MEGCWARCERKFGHVIEVNNDRLRRAERVNASAIAKSDDDTASAHFRKRERKQGKIQLKTDKSLNIKGL